MSHIEACPICGNNTIGIFRECTDFLVSRETFTLIHCNRCDFLITSPTPKDLTGYYKSEDYVSHTSSGTNLINRLYLTARVFTLRQKLSLVQKHAIKGKILDVGCGTGDFLEVCQKNGWSTDGVEPSDEARAIAAKKNLRVNSSLEENQSTALDAITLWHVLEHMPDLDVALKSLYSKLATNGTVFIAVPNFKSYDGTYYGSHWAGYDVPRHIWHFSKKAMENLLTKHSFKLTNVLPMKLDSYYVSLLSERYLKNGALSIPAMIRAFYRGFRSNLAARKENNYSSLIYIAKK